MNKHRDISFLCLFATQNQQGNPLLNILSLVVRAEKKLHVRIDTQNTKYYTLENTEYSILEYVVITKLQKKQIILIWNFPCELTQ